MNDANGIDEVQMVREAMGFGVEREQAHVVLFRELPPPRGGNDSVNSSGDSLRMTSIPSRHENRTGVHLPGGSLLKLSISWNVGSLEQEPRCSSLCSSSVNFIPHDPQNLNLWHRSMVITPTQIAQSTRNTYSSCISCIRT